MSIHSHINLKFRRSIHQLTRPLAFALVGTFVMWLARTNEVSAAQGLMCFTILAIPLVSYSNWKRVAGDGLPIFGILASMYWVYYAVPIFWEERKITEMAAPLGRELPDSMISLALLMALLGVCGLFAGMRSGIGRSLLKNPRTSLALSGSSTIYLRTLLAIGILINISGSTFSTSEGVRQAFFVLTTVVPMLAFAVLFRTWLRHRAPILDCLLVLAFVVTRVFSGLSSGWMGVSMAVIIVAGAVYVLERKRIPRIFVILVVAFILFFQVGKDDFRKIYWSGDGQSGQVERVGFWMQQSLNTWDDALFNPGSNALKEAIDPSISRVSLLTQSANVIEQTPAFIPYQYGSLYYYLLITWIPRSVWPDKPSINEANQYYQVAYGLTREEDLDKVSIAVGVLTEGYINFGWLGSIGVMFLLGVFFDFYQSTILNKASGLLTSTLGVILIPQFMAIDMQLAQYLAGVIQQVLFTLLILLPVIRIRRVQRGVYPRMSPYRLAPRSQAS